MTLGSWSPLRIAAAAVLAFALVLVGGVIGSHLGPKAVTVERRIIAPAIQAVQPGQNPEFFINLIQEACPAVVAIEDSGAAAVAATPPPATRRRGRHRRRRAAVAPVPAPPPKPVGFIVSPTGYLITSAGALSETGTLKVDLNDGRVMPAQRAAVDKVSGLALLKIDGTDLPTLEYADSGFPQLGQLGVVLAAPHGSGCIAQPAMISGDFLADGGGQRGYARLFPAAGPEFSGAPVIGSDGRVLGIAGVDPAPSRPEDAGKVLPATAASSVTTMLLRGDGPTNPYGLVAVELDANLAARLANVQQGAVIMLVQDGSPADRAGLRAGDVVIAADGSPLSGATELARALNTDQTEVTLDVQRGANRLTLTMRRAPEAGGGGP